MMLMTFIKSYKAIRSLVFDLLEKVPATRDDDNLLTYLIWKEEIGDRLVFMYGDEVLKMIADGKLSNPVTHRRRRQEAQQKHPRLRGKTYDFRHGISEPEMKKETA